jgi:hypothetical protein
LQVSRCSLLPRWPSCIDVHEDDVWFQGDCLLDIKGPILHAAEGRQLGDFGVLLEIGVVGFRVGFREIVAPADDMFEWCLPVEGREEVDLPALAENHVLDRRIHLNAASCDVRDGDRVSESRPSRGDEKGGDGAELACKAHRYITPVENSFPL